MRQHSRTLPRVSHVRLANLPFVESREKRKRDARERRVLVWLISPPSDPHNWSTANGHVTPLNSQRFSLLVTEAPSLRRPSPFLRSGRIDLFSHFRDLHPWGSKR